LAGGKGKAKKGGRGELVAGRDINPQAATGTDAKPLQIELINQVTRTPWVPDGLSENEIVERGKAAFAMLEGIKPKGEIEGLLAAQMVATHSAAMECLRRAMISGQSLAVRDLNLKHAAKLLSIYTRQVEVLDKHRGKGQQKVTVEHVHVEAGGQAIVGHVETGGRKLHKKSQSPAIEKAPEVPLETLNEQPAADKAATAKMRR
jgi:hypothetical protein